MKIKILVSFVVVLLTTVPLSSQSVPRVIATKTLYVRCSGNPASGKFTTEVDKQFAAALDAVISNPAATQMITAAQDDANAKLHDAVTYKSPGVVVDYSWVLRLDADGNIVTISPGVGPPFHVTTIDYKD